MKSHFILFITCSFSFTIICCSIFCSTSFGQQYGMSVYNKKKSITVNGKIEKISTMKSPIMKRYGLHIVVKAASSKKYFIHVCPQRCVDLNKEQFNFAKGEFVSVSGAQFKTGLTENNIYASTIDRKSGTLELRDPETGLLLCCRPNFKELYSMIMLREPTENIVNSFVDRNKKLSSRYDSAESLQKKEKQVHSHRDDELRNLLFQRIQQKRTREFNRRSRMILDGQ